MKGALSEDRMVVTEADFLCDLKEGEMGIDANWLGELGGPTVELKVLLRFRTVPGGDPAESVVSSLGGATVPNVASSPFKETTVAVDNLTSSISRATSLNSDSATDCRVVAVGSSALSNPSVLGDNRESNDEEVDGSSDVSVDAVEEVWSSVGCGGECVTWLADGCPSSWIIEWLCLEQEGQHQ
jgi:hypothetical protein